MSRSPYSLPSLSSLVAFEAASRHLSLTRAAAELNVTTGAISKNIKLLETEIGQQLFRRLHRSLTLTREGEVLAATLSESFEKISGQVKSLKSAADYSGVSVGTTTGIAQLWLLPKLAKFWADHQNIIIDHVISDRSQDQYRPDVDLRIRYGAAPWPDEQATKIFDDCIYPLASKAFLRSNPIKSPKDLSTMPLLSLEGPDPTWTSWASFLADQGLPTRKLNVRRFNSYVVALQAAQSGQGVVLGWARMVEPLVKSGQLVRVTKAEMLAPQSYYITWGNRKPLTRQAEILRDWLLANID
ncbi:MAG: LysR family transcriptional regulator [Alphaproteobacteria bacterium]|nr:LysR family transcriptional regulator [Alphaproteobacteria bacterium]